MYLILSYIFTSIADSDTIFYVEIVCIQIEHAKTCQKFNTNKIEVIDIGH